MRSLVWPAVAIMLAGCAFSGNSTFISIDSSGGMTSSREGVVDCEEHVWLDVDVPRRTGGSVKVEAVDGEGTVRFEQTFQARGEVDRQLVGAPGEWTLRLEMAAFGGKVTAKLAC